MRTVHDILDAGADDKVAFAAPDRPDLSYGELRMLAGGVRLRLRDAGIGRNERVAIVLPNGPEMAAAFLTIAASATTAPLNPNYRADEFKFYLEDLRARALIVDAGSDSPAIAVARDLGVAIHRLHVDPGAPAGAFRLELEPAARPGTGGWAEAEDTALVLHTSGTTSRPKIVPLSSGEYLRVRGEHPGDPRADTGRSLPQHHAAFPHSRAHGGRPVQHCRRGVGLRDAGLQRA